MIDKLEKVFIISTYGHRYPLKSHSLKLAIEKVKKNPLLDPNNQLLDFEKK